MYSQWKSNYFVLVHKDLAKCPAVFTLLETTVSLWPLQRGKKGGEGREEGRRGEERKEERREERGGKKGGEGREEGRRERLLLEEGFISLGSWPHRNTAE